MSLYISYIYSTRTSMDVYDNVCPTIYLFGSMYVLLHHICPPIVKSLDIKAIQYSSHPGNTRLSLPAIWVRQKPWFGNVHLVFTLYSCTHKCQHSLTQHVTHFAGTSIQVSEQPAARGTVAVCCIAPVQYLSCHSLASVLTSSTVDL